MEIIGTQHEHTHGWSTGRQAAIGRFKRRNWKELKHRNAGRQTTRGGDPNSKIEERGRLKHRNTWRGQLGVSSLSACARLLRLKEARQAAMQRSRRGTKPMTEADIKEKYGIQKKEAPKGKAPKAKHKAPAAPAVRTRLREHAACNIVLRTRPALPSSNLVRRCKVRASSATRRHMARCARALTRRTRTWSATPLARRSSPRKHTEFAGAFGTRMQVCGATCAAMPCARAPSGCALRT